MYSNLIRQAQTQIREAEESEGQAMFDNAAGYFAQQISIKTILVFFSELLEWLIKTKNAILNETVSPTAQAEEIVQKHTEIDDQIKVRFGCIFTPLNKIFR